MIYETGAGIINVVNLPFQGRKQGGGCRTWQPVQLHAASAGWPAGRALRRGPGAGGFDFEPSIHARPMVPCAPCCAGALGAMKGAGKGLVDLGYRPAKGVLLSAVALERKAHAMLRPRKAEVEGS